MNDDHYVIYADPKSANWELRNVIDELQAELTEALDLANHWAIATKQAQHELAALKAQAGEKCPLCNARAVLAQTEVVGRQIDALLNSTTQSTPAAEPVAIKNANGITLKAGWDDLPIGTELFTHPAAERPDHRAVLEQALEALDMTAAKGCMTDDSCGECSRCKAEQAITALRNALNGEV